MYKNIVEFVKDLYPSKEFIPLHAPVFQGNEKKYLNDCIDSTFVSSVGEYVNKFEKMMCDYTKAKYAVATTNGTSALHTALMIVGVEPGTEVLSQALTFVATANAISYVGATPIFIDSAVNNLGMCPESLEEFLNANAQIIGEQAFNKISKKRISACVPMHVFGNPVDINSIQKICKKFKIPLVEDAAESLGSYYHNEHTGLKGDVGILSFNGNKVVTCGGGGMIITNNEQLAKKAKHITTTAKQPHKWEFYHDEVGYNYRLPNINAAMACAQMEQLEGFIINKRQTADAYRKFFSNGNIKFVDESKDCQSNFWLNAVEVESKEARDELLEYTNKNGVMTRPIWRLMTELPAFAHSLKMPMKNAEKYVNTIVNLPSSVRLPK
ncbi:MAG: LegC family aminotransferase [Bacteriovorax sp.]|nr:LegC family aminotransferase [Bacteriovorax sp.]